MVKKRFIGAVSIEVLVILLIANIAFAGILSNVKAFWPMGDSYTTGIVADTVGDNNLTPYLKFNNATGKFRMGRNNNREGYYNQKALAALKGWGKWDRLLTSDEKIALYDKEYWPFSTTTTLQDAKVYYLLDEAGASSTYVDATGRGNTLTATGTTIRVAGPLGTDYGTKLDASTWLEKLSPGTDLQSSQANTTIVGWVNLTSKSEVQQVFWGQLLWPNGSETPPYETPYSGFNLYYDNSAADRFCVDYDAGDNKDISSGVYLLDTTLGSPTIDTWYLMIGELDYDNNRATLSINNGTQKVLDNIFQPTIVTGKVGNASRFFNNPQGSFATRTSGWDTGWWYPRDGNSHVYMTTPNSDVSIGNNSKTVWGWFYASEVISYQTLAGIFGGGANLDWAIQINNSRLYFNFGAEAVYADVAVTANAWNFVVGWFDKTANTVNIDLNHGAATDSSTGPATPQTRTTEFRFGSDKNSLDQHQFAGYLDAWGIADGVPTQDDLDILWNDGEGWEYGTIIGPFPTFLP